MMHAHLMMLRILHIINQLNMLIRTRELIGQRPDLFPQFRDELTAWVIVYGGFVGDVAGLGGIGEC